MAPEDDRELFESLGAVADPAVAPTDARDEFLAFRRVLELGRLCAEGDRSQFAVLRKHANDPRWRVREAVAMGLQGLGERHFNRLLHEMKRWARDGSWFERRAAVASLCRPGLLAQAPHVKPVLCMLDELTATMLGAADRRDDGFEVLRTALGDAWSVAVVAAPESGKRLLEKWMRVADPDIQWIVRENLKKGRLRRLDEAWARALVASGGRSL